MRVATLIMLVSLATTAVAEPEVTLKVKPVLCVVDERNAACEMAFVVIWESSMQGYYCLYNHFDARPLRCWDEELNGEFDETRVVSDGFRYWLTLGAANNTVASKAIEVMSVSTSDRRRKRRTRYVWDLN